MLVLQKRAFFLQTCSDFRSDVGSSERDSSVNAPETCYRGNDTLSRVFCQPLNSKNVSKLKLNEDIEILSVQVTSRNIFRLCSLCCGRRTPSDWSVTHTNIHTHTDAVPKTGCKVALLSGRLYAKQRVWFQFFVSKYKEQKLLRYKNNSCSSSCHFSKVPAASLKQGYSSYLVLRFYKSQDL